MDDNVTFFDQRPSHPQRPPLLQDAWDAMQDAWDAYNEACNRIYGLANRDGLSEDEAQELITLLRTALVTGDHYSDLYEQINAPVQTIDLESAVEKARVGA